MAGSRPAHLARRGAVYLVRFRLPHDLAVRLGILELRRSLHTTDSRLAKARCLEATRWFRTTVEELRSMTEPSRAALELAALSYFEHLKAGASGPRTFNEDFYEDEIDVQVELADEHADKYVQQLRTNAYSNFSLSEARRLSEAAKLGTPLPTASERELTRLVARA